MISERLAEIDTLSPAIGKLKIEKSISLYMARDNKSDQMGDVYSPYEKVGRFAVDEVSIEFYEGFIETITVDGEFDCLNRCKVYGMKNETDSCNIDYIVNYLKNKNEACEKDKFYKFWRREGDDKKKKKTNGYKKGNNKNDTIEKHDTIIIPEFKDQYQFEKKFGIGFSTRSNFGKLYGIKLHESVHGDFPFYIKLGDLIKYKYYVKALTRDYSPANGVVKLKGGRDTILRKEKTTKLLEAILYTDFLGFDQDNANGLVQLELAKRINIRSVRYQAPKNLEWLFHGGGFLQYVKPSLTLSKIEDNNRFLVPETDDRVVQNGPDNELVTRSIASPIEIVNQQNISLGVDLNLLFLDNPDLKYHAHLNIGTKYGRTAVRDSIRTLNANNLIEKTGLVDEFQINYNIIHAELMLQLLPEERFSILISDKMQYFSSAFSEIDLKTIDKNSIVEETTTKWFNSFEFLGSLKVGQNGGRLFGRWRYNSQLGNLKENFHQLQFGYSFYILQKN